MITAWEIGELKGEAPVRVPTYPIIRSIVLIGAFLTSVQFLFMLVDSLRKLFKGDANTASEATEVLHD